MEELERLPTSSRLCRVAGDGQITEVKSLLAREPRRVAEPDDHGNTPLFHAVWSNHIPVIDVLLLQMTRDEVNWANKEGNTALHFAVARGRSHILVMEKLMAAGASFVIKNHDDESAQDLVRTVASLKHNKQVLRMFELAGAKFIGNEFMATVKKAPTASGTSPAKAADVRYRDPSRSRAAQMSSRYVDVKSMLRNDENFGDLNAVFELLTNGIAPGSSSGKRTATVGIVHAKHLAPIFEFLGLSLTERQLQAVLTELDVNNDGIVTVDDFWKALLVRNTTGFSTRHSYDAPFAAFDHDGDGIIGVDDMRRAHAKLGGMTCATNDSEIFHILRSHVGNHDMASDSKMLGIDRHTFMRLARGDGPSQAGSLLQHSIAGAPPPPLTMMLPGGTNLVMSGRATPAPPMSPPHSSPRPYYRTSSVVAPSSSSNASSGANNPALNRASSVSTATTYMARANSSSTSSSSHSPPSSSRRIPHPPSALSSSSSSSTPPSSSSSMATPLSASRTAAAPPTVTPPSPPSASSSLLARSGPSTVSGSSVSSSYNGSISSAASTPVSGRSGINVSSLSTAVTPPLSTRGSHGHHLALTPSPHHRSSASGSSRNSSTSNGPPSPLLSPPSAMHVTRRSFSD